MALVAAGLINLSSRALELTTAGWTIFEDVYLFNGTWYIVTENPSDVPLIRMIVSTGAEVWNDEGSIKSR